MNKRRTPIESQDTSTVIYPSAILSLERDEVYPYERFAFNTLAVALEALHAKKLSQRLTVDFNRQGQGGSAWDINATTTVDLGNHGCPTGFRFSTPVLFPANLYMFTATIGLGLCDPERFRRFQGDPSALRERIQFFVDGASVGVRTYKDKGPGTAIRAAYEHLGHTRPN